MGTAIYNPQNPNSATRCFQFNRKALSQLEADHSIQVVILAAYWGLPFRPGSGPDDNGFWLTSESAKTQEIPTLDASTEILKRTLTATIQGLLEAGKEVIVFEDVPNFAVSPKSRIRTARIPARHALAVWLGTGDASDPGFASPDMVPEVAMSASAVKEVVAGLSGVALVDLEPELCRSASQCAYRYGGRMLYSDTDHLTADGANYALRDFRLPTPAVSNN
jgi:hypothetical protein